MIKGSINSIETLGTLDGPGLRTIVFLNGCALRCKFCHNPEMFKIGDLNTTPQELLKKIKRYKPYYNRNNGGVTFSGGDPLLQTEFLISVCKLLKNENIHVAIDTSGVGTGDYNTLLDYVDLIIFDVKSTTKEGFLELTGGDFQKIFDFLKIANSKNKKFWVRQVIIPGVNDNKEYILSLRNFVRKHIKNVEKIELLPFHNMAKDKYKKLGLDYAYEDLAAMDNEKIKGLYEYLGDTREEST